MRILALLVLAGCAYANAPQHWPDRGPFVQVENLEERPLRVEAVDGMGRHLVLGTVLHTRTLCVRWPFVDRIGYLIAGVDTLYFQPWTKAGWRLDPQTHVLEGTAGFCS